MTTPPTNSNVAVFDAPGATAPAPKPGPPRALILGGAVIGVGALAAAAFYFMQNKSGDGADAGGDAPPATPAQQIPVPPKPPVAQGKPKAKPTPAANAGKAQAAQALGAFGNGRIRLDTSFDGVPVSLGGTGGRKFPATPIPAADNGGKVKPIVQGKLPVGLRSDPFVSRLIVPIAREFAYTLAIPYRLAPPAKPLVLPAPKELDPELALGPLPYVPRRVAGFLEFGGVSAILESGSFGGGSIDIVTPGSTVASGLPGIPPLTVESISSSELVLRAVDGRSVRVALSGVPGGVNVPGGEGGGPPGVPGGLGGRPGGGRGARGGRGGGGAGTAD